MLLSDEANRRVNELNSELKQLSEEIDDLLTEVTAINSDPNGIDYSKVEALMEKLRVTSERYERTRHAIEDLERLRGQVYIRPTGGLYSLVNRLHPITPDDSTLVQPNTQELKKLRPMHLPAILSLVVSVVVAYFVTQAAPWTATPPPTLLYEAIHSATGSKFIAIATCAIAIIAYIYFFSSRSRTHTPLDSTDTRFLDRMAADKEHWFRLGAEKWGIGYQVWVAMVFGLCYVGPFIPVAAMVAAAVFGFILTRVYVRAYRRSGGSVRTAILTSTKFHSTIMAWIGVAAAIILAAYIFDIFF